MTAKKFSQFTCVHVKSANRAELTRVAKPQIKIEYASGFPVATRDAVHAFFFDKSKKTQASSTLEWHSVSWPARAESKHFREGLRVTCRCGAIWETVVHFNNGTTPDQAKKRLYDKLSQKHVQLLPQQAVLRDEFRDYDWNSHKRNSYLLYWTMGSGKTRAALSALAAAKHTSKNNEWSRVLIVCSNTLIGNWIKTIEQSPQCNGYTKFVIMGYNEFRNTFHDSATSGLGDISRYIVIVDEAHYYRNLTPMMMPDVALLRRSLFLMLLTGTPLQNEPDEICALLALKQCCDDVQARSDQFECNPDTLQRQRASIAKQLEKQKSVFYYDPEVYDAQRFANHYPATHERVEHVAMSAPQALEYIMSLRAETKIGPYSIQTARCNSYDSLTRALSNVVDPAKPAESPKIRHVVRNVLSGKWPAPHVIFSHYRDRGVHAVDKHLAEQMRKHGKKLKRVTISGSTEGRERDSIVNDYNSGKIDALSITDAAREGVDLHGTGTMHVLESAQNLHGESQTMSRVARFGSHSKLPPSQQSVTFIKYHSAFPSVAAMEKQRQELEQYFESTYKLKARGEFDIVKELARLFKQLENGQTVDERYAKNNLEKAKLLLPWLDMLKRVGDRKREVAAVIERRHSEPTSSGRGTKRKREPKMTVKELDTACGAITIKKALQKPLTKKRKMENNQKK